MLCLVPFCGLLFCHCSQFLYASFIECASRLGWLKCEIKAITKISVWLNADHPWVREDGDASDKPLDIAVLTRMKQFRAMNKLKKVALKVRLLPFYYNHTIMLCKDLKNVNVWTHRSEICTWLLCFIF